MYIYAPQPLQAPCMRTMLTAVGGDDECSSDCDLSLEECSTPIQRLLRTLNISPPGPTSDDLRRFSPSTESFTASECFRASEGASTPESFRHHFQRPTTNQPPVQINSLDPGWMHPCPQPLLFGSLPNGLLPCTMNFLDHPARNDFAAMGFGSQVTTSATPNNAGGPPDSGWRMLHTAHIPHDISTSVAEEFYLPATTTMSSSRCGSSWLGVASGSSIPSAQGWTPTAKENRVPRYFRHKHIQQPRIYGDPYGGGATTVLTGGVMLGGGPHFPQILAPPIPLPDPSRQSGWEE
ncbi:hypothetical protein B0H13DRAFT_2666475 [Mycena leptocephala]|nr:hypothetical protein B0H13DRAFT_2666475 [Mycena leptocephala]